jgi:hypothetical protein
VPPLLCEGTGNNGPLPYRSSEPNILPREGEVDVGFFDILAEVVAVLRCESRVTYWALAQEFGFDAAFLDGVRRELIFKQVARDVEEVGLIWTGRAQPAEAPVVREVVPAVIVSPAPLTLPPLTLVPEPTSMRPITVAEPMTPASRIAAPAASPENGRGAHGPSHSPRSCPQRP